MRTFPKDEINNLRVHEALLSQKLPPLDILTSAVDSVFDELRCNVKVT